MTTGHVAGFSKTERPFGRLCFDDHIFFDGLAGLRQSASARHGGPGLIVVFFLQEIG